MRDRNRVGLWLMLSSIGLFAAGLASAVLPWEYGKGLFTPREQSQWGRPLEGEENFSVYFDLCLGPVVELALVAVSLLVLGFGMGFASAGSSKSDSRPGPSRKGNGEGDSRRGAEGGGVDA